jgi:hypothetical protein
MGSFPSQPVAQNLAGLWGGAGFGGLGSPGAVPLPAPGSMPGTYLPVTGPQNMQQAPPAALANPGAAGQPTPLTPLQVQAQMARAGQGGGLASQQQQGNIWDRLMGAVGQGALPKMPGTTVGAPAGQAAPPPPPPMMPMTQGPPPPAVGAFRGFQQPSGAGGAGNNALMAQYMALQQLMRGS